MLHIPIEKFAAISFTTFLSGLCSSNNKNSMKNAVNNIEVPITSVLNIVE